MIVLGIETSCDETAVAIVEDDLVRSNLITAQIDVHSRFGGVVPELASREHLRAINRAIAQSTEHALISMRDIEAIAVTIGPGLIGALLVGVAAAKSLAMVLDVPLIGVNHLEGHVESAFIDRKDLAPPVIALIVSGGHTMIAEMPEHGRFDILGQTIDDAAGEAFDKIARFLGLPFPGGPEIDRLARKGNANAVRFPRAMMGDDSFDFSLSGLKTAVIRWIRERQAAGEDFDPADVAASFQEAVVDVQVAKTLRAAEERGRKTIILAGGVAANSRLRERMSEEAAERGIDVVVPPPRLCTDNGAMIAAAGLRRLARGESTSLDVAPDANLSLA
ncbi:MAG: tRNA (adenosine(37)-N6)-threonylcarbamoyltransferase complex transferase subunit TsaD [Actinomycetota bacterium]|nr:tRNA (adenosine(37)-N6)-threonylcarbamoyltransferase complex transferase subunit TsaD [Actinomycetota bacterium]